jgi:asparagine N-glycosylation enzyme membrane subunit Stt3
MVMLSGHWRQYNDALDIEPVQWETLSFLGAWGPFLAGYGAIFLCARLGFLPLFNLFPPPPQDPVSRNPSWGAVGAIFMLGLTTAAILYLLGWFLTRKIRRPDFNASKLILLIVLLAVVALAFLYNSYWAVSFLALPALVWPLINPARAAGERAANILFVLAACLPFYLAQLGFARLTGLGWGAIWYQILGLNGGLFTFGGFCLASATAALAIRFATIQFSPSDRHDSPAPSGRG